MFDVPRFTRAALRASKTPLDASTPTPNVGEIYGLLPRVFPVTNRGDMPGALDLPLDGDSATNCIGLWETANSADPATFSRS